MKLKSLNISGAAVALETKVFSFEFQNRLAQITSSPRFSKHGIAGENVLIAFVVIMTAIFDAMVMTLG